MFVKQLKLINFRNYESLDVQFDSPNIYITGENASGKTNIIEAIQYLSCGRSFRKASDSELIKNGASEAYLSMLYHSDKDDKDHTIASMIGNNYKVFFFDDEKVKTLSSIFGKFLVVYYDPSQVFFFKNEPSDRRRLMDETLSQLSPKYLYAISRYKKLLKERNAALNHEYDQDVIDVLRNQLINLSYRIVLDRTWLVKSILSLVNTTYQNLFGENSSLQLIYKTNCPIETDQQYYTEQAIKLFDRNKSNENLKKQTLIGPHRDDLGALLNKKDLASYGSQGENRIATLSLKIGLKEHLKKKLEDEPVLLLDDVTSDLDKTRMKNLLSHLSTGQTFVTGTRITEEFKNYSIYETDGKEIRRK